MMLSEKISFEFDLFQVEDKKWGAYVKVIATVTNAEICPISRVKLMVISGNIFI